MLETLKECLEFKQNFENCFIFGLNDQEEIGSGAIADQLGCITVIQSFTEPLWPITLTTSLNALGHDLNKVAYVIQTKFTKSYSLFVQNAGRADRTGRDTPLTGAFITEKNVKTI